jgi:hypothetical protein
MFRKLVSIFIVSSGFFVLIAQTGRYNTSMEPLMSLVHTPGNLNVDIFNDGSIGHDNSGYGYGLGVTWKGIDGCFVGGPIFGNATRMSVNGDLSSFFIQDIQNVSSNFSAGFMSDPDFDQITEAILDDGWAPAPYDVEITQKTYSNTGEEFVFIRYGFKNTSSSTLSSSVGGIFVDWDIGDPFTNSGGYSLLNNMCYQFDNDSVDYYYGLISLDGSSGMRVTREGSSATIRTESYNFITTYDQFNELDGDFRSWIGTSCGNIEIGETVWVTFALVAGDNLANLVENALYANLKSANLGWGNLFPGIYPWIEPLPADFGDIEINTSSESLTIILQNWGVDDLIISNIATSVGPFTLETNYNYPITLSTSDIVEAEVVFSPVVSGSCDEILAITSNDPSLEGFHLIGNGYNMFPVVEKTIYASSGSQNNGNILTIDKSTGASSIIGPSLFDEVKSIAIDPDSYIIYGLIPYNNNADIIRINSRDGDSYYLCNIDIPLAEGIAFDTTGILYGISRTGEIYTINLTDSSNTFVVDAEGSFSSITFHPVTNELWSTSRSLVPPNKDAIIKIDLTTGETTIVGHTGLGKITNDLFFDEGPNLYGVIGSSTEINDFIIIDAATGVGTIIGSVGYKHILGLAYTELVSSVKYDNSLLPKQYSLKQNFPNPFNPNTTIKYEIPERTFVELKVYDILGREVELLVNEEKDVGYYEVNLNASDFSSGIYLYRLQAGSYIETKKMLLIK